MRRGLSWAGGRIMNAGMSVSIQQDKAVAAIAAAAAAGCSLCQQQPWQRRASAVVASKRRGLDGVLSLRSVFGSRTHHTWRKSALFSKLPFSDSSEFCAREFSSGSVTFKVADSEAFDEKANERHETVDEAPAVASTQCRDSSEDKPQESTSEEVSKGKGNPESGLEETSKLQLDYAAAMLPHPSKAAKGGEDAFFLEGSWMGVADGVGGWALEGIDSGLYSRELMRHCKNFASKSRGKPQPGKVIIEAVSSTKAEGSSTVLVAALFEQKLYAANLGDTGFIVIRDWEVVEESQPMQRQFNFPYQVGSYGDNPNQAQTYEVALCKGDIIVLGTDGLFDNLFNHEIVSILKNTLGSGASLQAAATKLVNRAQVIGADPTAQSPFARAAASCFLEFNGGKLDDVTTVVACVT